MTITVSVCSPGWRDKVHTHILAHLDHDIGALQRFEALELGADRIGSGNEAGRGILPRGIGRQGAGDASLNVDHCDCCPDDSAAALVGDRTEDAPIVELSLRRRCQQDDC